MRHLNENISYAKSILNKKGINADSPDYKDYLKIREICGNNSGYVGILTRIRFVDDISDMDEIKSIFDVLKSSKIDINKLNRMSYDEILDVFYDEFNKKDNKDYELIYKDSEYSYFKVYTYEGILKIGSPSWCLKTKSNWDKYIEVYPSQWVVINNKYIKNIITPNNSYLSTYVNKSKPWVRYGISMKSDLSSYLAFNDNNYRVKHTPDKHTFFGVFTTIINLEKGIFKSFYESMPGCEIVEGSQSWQKVIDRKRICNIFELPEGFFDNQDEIYMYSSKTYSDITGFLLFDIKLIRAFYPKNISDASKITHVRIESGISKKLLEDYAMRHDWRILSGIHLLKGKKTITQIMNNKYFFHRVGKWLIFENENYYQVVNTDTDTYEIPTYAINTSSFDMKNPMFFYVDKKTYEVFMTNKTLSSSYADEVIKYIKSIEKAYSGAQGVEPLKGSQGSQGSYEPKTGTNNDAKKVKSFWDFFKRK
jgi:hypothetical protein